MNKNDRKKQLEMLRLHFDFTENTNSYNAYCKVCKRWWLLSKEFEIKDVMFLLQHSNNHAESLIIRI